MIDDHEPWVLPHMNNQPNDTVRRFPRTQGEAFRDAEWASSITTPHNHVIGFHGSMRPGRRRPVLRGRFDAAVVGGFIGTAVAVLAWVWLGSKL